MKKKINFNFFKKVFLAITDFRFYPHVLKTEGLYKSFAYFLKLILLLSLVITIYLSQILFVTMDKIVEEFDYDNSQKEQSTELFTEEFKAAFLERYSQDELQLVINEYKNNANAIKIIMVCIIYPMVFAVLGLIKICSVLFIALFVSVVAAIFRIATETGNYIKLAIYVITLPSILEVASILLVGGIKDYTMIASTLLTMVYVFYAVRAIKFDAFLIIMRTSENKKRTKNIQMENEDITKQMEKDEKKEESEVQEKDKNQGKKEQEHNEENEEDINKK